VSSACSPKAADHCYRRLRLLEAKRIRDQLLDASVLNEHVRDAASAVVLGGPKDRENTVIKGGVLF
jgi:hypothetical protein